MSRRRITITVVAALAAGVFASAHAAPALQTAQYATPTVAVNTPGSAMETGGLLLAANTAFQWRMQTRPTPPPAPQAAPEAVPEEWYDYYPPDGWVPPDPYLWQTVPPMVQIPMLRARPLMPPPMRFRMRSGEVEVEPDPHFRRFFTPRYPDFQTNGYHMYEMPPSYYYYYYYPHHW